MTLSGSALTLIAVAVILVVVVLAIFLVLSRRLRAKRDRILNELGAKPELVQDRAFNRLAMARREADVLARTGADTGRARELIAQSQGAFDTHDFPRSYELAQSAHEALVNAHGRVGPLSVAVPRAPGMVDRTVPPAAVPDPTAPPPPAPLPRNRAESQFQLRLLDQEVLTARKERPSQGTTLEAIQLQTQAQAAFDRAEYTDAFRLALRARRSLGGKVEALAATPRMGGAGSAPDRAEDPTATADRVAGANRCSNCGSPSLPDDTFCRGCGTPRTANACASCGAPRATSDTFCGRCGTQFTA